MSERIISSPDDVTTYQLENAYDRVNGVLNNNQLKISAVLRAKTFDAINALNALTYESKQMHCVDRVEKAQQELARATTALENHQNRVQVDDDDDANG